MLAYDYPLLGFFWSVLIFFLWIMWFMLLFHIIGDIFRSADLSGVAKTLWIIFVIFLPFLGVFVYVIARGNSMTQRSIDRAEAQRSQFDSYVRETASSNSAADEIAKLADLKDRGLITDGEFAARRHNSSRDGTLGGVAGSDPQSGGAHHPTVRERRDTSATYASKSPT
jgi:hypothetical protein